MISSWWFRSAAISVVAVAGLAARPAAALAQSSPPSLFVESARGPAVRGAARPDVARMRRLSVRTDLLSAALAPGTSATAPFVMNLFPDVTLTLVRERLESDPGGYTTWVGAVAGDRESAASLTWNGRVLVGAVVSRGVAYDITTASDGLVSVSERAATETPLELPVRVPARFAAERAPLVAAAEAGAAAIDLLVLYTPAARERAGGEAQIKALLANAVAVTNGAFQRSAVNAVVTAVGIQELAYVESGGLGNDLTAISLGGEQSAVVEAARAAKGADLVALVTGRTSSSGGCGVAWIGPSSSAAYSVSEHACLYAGQWSFSHELGHNLGADHAPGDSAPVGASYARGYRDATIRTLMAYAVYGSPPRILNFSNPNVREPAAGGMPTGSSLQDNARRLNETAATVAGYVPSTAPQRAPPTPTGLVGHVSGQSVALSWAGVGDAASYLVQGGRAPGDASAFNVTVASPSLSGPVPPGTYYWRVRAQNASGASAASPDAVFTVTPSVAGPPAVPAGLVAQVSGSTVTLSWAPGAGGTVSGYELEGGPSQGSGAYGRIPLAQTSIAIPNVPNGIYYLRVRAVGPGGPSAPTADAVVTVGQACAAPGVGTLSSMVAGGTVTLTWTAPSGSGPFTYSLGVGSSAGGTEFGVHAMGAATAVAATPPPGTYYVRVFAANACGLGAASSDVTLTIP